MPSSPNQKEIIDARILRLVGLEDVFDIDYETYLTLLKEAMVKGRMTKTQLSTEETELLTNEFKRVKSKKDKGRFEVKSKKISASSLGKGIKSVGAKILGSKPKALLPSSGLKLEKKEEAEDILTSIQKTVDSIYKLLLTQQKNLKDAAEKQRRQQETERRKATESRLEKGFSVVAKVAKKFLAPVKSILDRIIGFFIAIFLGRVVYKLLEWFADPKNKRKVNAIFRFLGDHWPKLLGLYIAFGTRFGRFVRRLSKLLIKGVVSFAAKNPKIAAVVGVTAATAAVIAALSGQLKGKKDKDNKNEESTFGFFGGGPVNVFQLYASGGFVSGQKGIDKIPAMLTDGEFVMSRGAVQRFGLDTLMAMNASGGGTNIPRMIGGIPHAQGGGFFGNARNFFGNMFGRKPTPPPSPPVNKISSTGVFKPSGGKMVDPLTGMSASDFSRNTAAYKPMPSGPASNNIARTGVYNISGGKMVDPITGMTPLDFKSNLQINPRVEPVKPNALQRLQNWWNTGRNVRVPNESTASWRQLMSDDMRQITRTNKAFKSGARGLRGWNPIKAFTPGMVKTGPTPAVRQAFERPIRGLASGFAKSAPALRFAGRGLQILNAPVIGDMILPEGTSAYDQISGPNAYYNAPGYRRAKPPVPMRFAGGPAPNTAKKSYSVSQPMMQGRTRVMYVNTPSGGGGSGGNYSVPSGQTVPSFSAVSSSQRRYAKASQLGIG